MSPVAEQTSTARPVTAAILTAAVVLVAVVILYQPVLSAWQGGAPASGPQTGDDESSRLPTIADGRDARIEAWRRVQPRLEAADHECRRLIPASLAVVDGFFDDSCARSPNFADALLGWGSKWHLVVDHLPLTRTDRHAEFIQHAFREYLFTPEQLGETVEQSVQSYLAGVNGVENRLLVQIRADLADLPASLLPVMQDDQQLRSAFVQAMAEAASGVRADLRMDLARETASLVAGEVLTMVVVRLGVSAGILSAGAGTSWATLGIGLVAGLIVDQVVTWVWRWWSDPVGELAQGVNEKLRQIELLILNGEGASPGLRGRLRTMSEQRADMRRKAIGQLFGVQE